jgi:alkylation response protein AidB-like acyl-CoA dehydrogenase
MRFAFTEDQDELRATVRALLERHATSTRIRAAAEREDGFAPDLWRVLVEQMELTSVAIAEAHGGTGATFVELGIVLAELGRVLAPVPYLSTVTAAAAIEDAAASAVAGSLLARVVEGAAATLAVADAAESPAVARAAGDGHVLAGVKEHVLDGSLADLLVVSAAIDGERALFAVEGADVEREPLSTLDATRRQARVRLDGAPAVRLTAPGDGERALAHALDLVRVALAAESVGAADRCLELTLDYLRERVQFGRPIGSFQALKHRCADLAVEVEAATSTAWYAAWAAADAPDELPVVAPLAKAVCGDAFLHMAAETIQLHGGIGFTWEHDAHLYFKRAKSTELLFGSSREQRRLVSARAGIL